MHLRSLKMNSVNTSKSTIPYIICHDKHYELYRNSIYTQIRTRYLTLQSFINSFGIMKQTQPHLANLCNQVAERRER